MTDRTQASGELEGPAALQRFFHDLATPLSAVSLHLERACRLSDRGEDPTEALSVARRELERTFELFERARDSLLARGEMKP
jgi:signal transduction histidine kinase